MSIHPVASRLTWSTPVVPKRVECQPWLMNAKSSHSYSGDAVLFQDCNCKKKHGFNECQHGTADALVNLAKFGTEAHANCNTSVKRSTHADMGIADSQSPL